MSYDSESTEVTLRTTLEEVALGQHSWAPINVPTPFISLRIFTMVQGREFETRTRVTSEAINEPTFWRDFLSKEVLASIRKALYA